MFEEGRAWNRLTGEPYEDFAFLYDDFVKACRMVEASEYMLENDLILEEGRKLSGLGESK